MSTFMPKVDEIERKWYVIDAADKPLGRVAAEAAVLLRGKHKPIFTPNADCGDFVIIINTDKAVLTGGKLTKKYYQHHTGYIGNLKEVQYSTLMKEKSDFAMQLAVKGMIPDTTLGRKQLTRCKIYKDAQHKHEAQKPEAWE
ncbi:MAG: 50S ribosomal protein L13, partial [Eubacterium sp.]|nr:50S ribosomal protein L13 [Eubacterium sp.]